MPKLLFLAGLVLAAALVAGCSSGGDRPPATSAPTSTSEPSTPTLLLLNESANGTTHTVPIHSNITLKLNENPTTGYSWNLTTTEGLRVLSDGYVSDDPAGTRAGAGGVHTWNITATAAGLQDIKGVYARPWENSTADATTFSVEISVTP
jgi:inhibitor of cysteine peptidase